MRSVRRDLAKLLALGAAFCLFVACGYEGVKSSALENQPELQTQKVAFTEATFFNRGISRGKVYLKISSEVSGPSAALGYGLFAVHKPGTNEELSIRLCSVRDATESQYIAQIRSVVEQVNGAFLVRASEIPEIQAQIPGAYLVVLQRPYFSTNVKLRERNRAKLFSEAVAISLPGEQNTRTCSFLVDANQLKAAMRPRIRTATPNDQNQAGSKKDEIKRPTLEDIALDPKFSE